MYQRWPNKRLRLPFPFPVLLFIFLFFLFFLLSFLFLTLPRGFHSLPIRQHELDKVFVHDPHVVLFQCAPYEMIAIEETRVLDRWEVVFGPVDERLNPEVNIFVDWQEVDAVQGAE